MLTIWGRMNSINVQKVVWAAEELGLSYVRHEAGLQHGVVDTPEYRAKNPNGLVPTIEDGGVVIWESNAIVRYLAARYGEGTIWPADPALRAESDRWMDWQAETFSSAYIAAFRGLVRTPPEQRDAAAIEASRARTETQMAILDAHLAGRDHLGSAGFGIGDIALAPLVHRWLLMPIERTPRPHAEAWRARLMARPGARIIAGIPLS